ncbi:hypothetical protein lbkm_0833 [Lachnospiraceae bacterium KM106-2]|nr:hypothetical protein lbkm_0833 [Lachnospiraceae bacterium KM106-2]
MTACSKKEDIITKRLPKESTKEEESEKKEKDQIHIYQNTYHTYVSNNSNGGLSIFNPKDNNRIQTYQYDSANKKYTFENIDYRYNFHETYMELSSETSKIVDGSISPDGTYAIIEEKGDGVMQYYTLNLTNQAKQPFLAIKERFKNGQPVYQIQFDWSDDGTKLAYGIQLRDLNLSHPSYYDNTEEFQRVTLLDVQTNKTLYIFHRHNLQNDSILYNYKLLICGTSSKIIIYNNSYLGKLGNNEISIIDTNKKGKGFAKTIPNDDAYNTNLTYQDGILYRLNGDRNLAMMDMDSKDYSWNTFLYRESNIVAYIPFKDQSRFIVVEDDKTETIDSSESGVYNIYLCSKKDNSRKLLYKTSNPFLSIKLNNKENRLLLESMMPYYNNESYVEADLNTTVIQF